MHGGGGYGPWELARVSGLTLAFILVLFFVLQAKDLFYCGLNQHG